MNFSGWAAIPRSLVRNTHHGRLTNNEQLTLLTLWLLADCKTGAGRINAAALRTYLPELSYTAAKRALLGLQTKRVIYRQIVHASKNLYPFWIHGFQISDGPHKLLWTSLAEVFISDDVRDVAYSKSVPEDIPEDGLESGLEDVPEPEPEAEPNNNRDRDFDNYKDSDSPLGLIESSSLCAPSSASADQKERTTVPTVVPRGAHLESTRCEHGSTMAPCKVGLRWDAYSGEWLDKMTNVAVPLPQVRQRIARINLELWGNEFIETVSGSSVPRTEALERIAA